VIELNAQEQQHKLKALAAESTRHIRAAEGTELARGKGASTLELGSSVANRASGPVAKALAATTSAKALAASPSFDQHKNSSHFCDVHDPKMKPICHRMAQEKITNFCPNSTGLELHRWWSTQNAQTPPAKLKCIKPDDSCSPICEPSRQREMATIDTFCTVNCFKAGSKFFVGKAYTIGCHFEKQVLCQVGGEKECFVRKIATAVFMCPSTDKDCPSPSSDKLADVISIDNYAFGKDGELPPAILRLGGWVHKFKEYGASYGFCREVILTS